MSFVGLAKYYRQFVQNFAHTCAPLTDLFRKDAESVWGDTQQLAFDALKHGLSNAPTLAVADPKLPYVRWTDASDVAVGAILCQDHGNGPLLIVYESRKMHASREELHYS